jgi:hypothetical protein
VIIDHGLAGGPARTRDLLLPPGDLFDRQFDTKVTTRNHQGVRKLCDLGQPVEGCRFLDLRQDPGAPRHDLARFSDIFRSLHEG